MVPPVAFCAKAARVCARLAALCTQAPAVDVVDKCDRRNETPLIVAAQIACAANVANEIGTDCATPWTFYLGSHRCHPYVTRRLMGGHDGSRGHARLPSI
jgi:quinolinate synthase